MSEITVYTAMGARHECCMKWRSETHLGVCRVMALWAKTIVAVAVVVIPGAFVAFLAFACARAIKMRWQVAQQLSQGGPVPVRQVLSSLRFSDIVKEARAAF